MEAVALARIRMFVSVVAALFTCGALLLISTDSADALVVEPDIAYGSGSDGNPGLKQLDVYRPAGAGAGDLRPVVVYVHGGGWLAGDKSNKMDFKPRLFTDAGYIFVSVNYRLSPGISSVDPDDFAPGRLKFPEHPRDVAEAVAWVGRNISDRGGDPDAIMLLGHSAGGHLVSLVGTNPAYLNEWGASLRQVLGVIPMDAGAFDVVDSARQVGANPTTNNLLIWNGFGTPAENALTGNWLEASPPTWANPTDPPHLLITQASRLTRIHDNQKMADLLGQDPLEVFKSPLDHEGINDVLGDPEDSTGETTAVMNFIAVQVRRRIDPAISILKRPARTIRMGPGKKKRKVVFKFLLDGDAAGAQCRLDSRKFSGCRSPHSFRTRAGRHVLRLRALYPSGRPGAVKVVKFKVVQKKRPR